MAVDLRNEMVELRRNLLTMGAAVEQRVTRVIESMIDGDLSLAESVTAGDSEIDRMELELEASCMRLLALAQPVVAIGKFELCLLGIAAKGIAAFEPCEQTRGLGKIACRQFCLGLGIDLLSRPARRGIRTLATQTTRRKCEAQRRGAKTADAANARTLTLGGQPPDAACAQRPMCSHVPSTQ